MDMTYSHLDPAAQNRVPWNYGAKIGLKRPSNQKQIWAIRFFLDREGRAHSRRENRDMTEVRLWLGASQRLLLAGEIGSYRLALPPSDLSWRSAAATTAQHPIRTVPWSRSRYWWVAGWSIFTFRTAQL